MMIFKSNFIVETIDLNLNIMLDLDFSYIFLLYDLVVFQFSDLDYRPSIDILM